METLKEHGELENAQIRPFLRLMRIELDSKTNRPLPGRCSSFFVREVIEDAAEDL